MPFFNDGFKCCNELTEVFHADNPYGDTGYQFDFLLDPSVGLHPWESRDKDMAYDALYFGVPTHSGALWHDKTPCCDTMPRVSIMVCTSAMQRGRDGRLSLGLVLVPQVGKGPLPMHKMRP